MVDFGMKKVKTRKILDNLDEKRVSGKSRKKYKNTYEYRND